MRKYIVLGQSWTQSKNTWTSINLLKRVKRYNLSNWNLCTKTCFFVFFLYLHNNKWKQKQLKNSKILDISKQTEVYIIRNLPEPNLPKRMLLKVVFDVNPTIVGWRNSQVPFHTLLPSSIESVSFLKWRVLSMKIVSYLFKSCIFFSEKLCDLSSKILSPLPLMKEIYKCFVHNSIICVK